MFNLYIYSRLSALYIHFSSPLKLVALCLSLLQVSKEIFYSLIVGFIFDSSIYALFAMLSVINFLVFSLRNMSNPSLKATLTAVCVSCVKADNVLCATSFQTFAHTLVINCVNSLSNPF